MVIDAKIKDLIARGALFVANNSGGKDSQIWRRRISMAEVIAEEKEHK